MTDVRPMQGKVVESPSGWQFEPSPIVYTNERLRVADGEWQIESGDPPRRTVRLAEGDSAELSFTEGVPDTGILLEARNWVVRAPAGAMGWRVHVTESPWPRPIPGDDSRWLWASLALLLVGATCAVLAGPWGVGAFIFAMAATVAAVRRNAGARFVEDEPRHHR